MQYTKDQAIKIICLVILDKTGSKPRVETREDFIIMHGTYRARRFSIYFDAENPQVSDVVDHFIALDKSCDRYDREKKDQENIETGKPIIIELEEKKDSAYKMDIRELLWAMVIVGIVNAIVIAIKF